MQTPPCSLGRGSRFALALFGLWLGSLAGEAAPARAEELACAGDCNGVGRVTVDGIVNLVRISGGADSSACPQGIPAGAEIGLALLTEAVANALAGCPGATPEQTATATPTPTSASTPTPTSALPSPSATTSGTPPTPGGFFCDLPGSVRNIPGGHVIIPGGGPEAGKLSYLHLPVGFCAHFFARVGNARQLRFAPGGELFVASPTTITTGGGPDGRSAIVVLTDDDGDGLAEAPITFLEGLPSTQGLLFTGGYFYYQDGTKILRRPYAAGDRAPKDPVEQMADINSYFSRLHWPKPMDVADDGTIYVGNGGDQTESCRRTGGQFHGGIFALDGSPGALPVAKGFRNPIAVRCSRGHNLCFAIELTKDFTNSQGGREKVVPIRQGGDWGFPCCATKDIPYPDVPPLPDCSGVATEPASFNVGGTPFDLDFETGRWPAPWRNRVFIPLHGAYGNWEGARMVAIEVDQTTGDILPGTDLGGPSSGAMSDFAVGWDDGSLQHGRPANVAFSTDGRLFLGNDNTGDIVWIAPFDLPR